MDREQVKKIENWIANEFKPVTGGPAYLAYLTLTGSRAYGLETPDSDYDYRGVYVPPLVSMIEGLGKAEVLNIPGVVKDDVVLYPIHQFLKLAGQSNPNILDLLFAPDDCVVVNHDRFNSLVRSRRKEFLIRDLHLRIKGFAQSMLTKMLSGGTRDLGAKRKQDIEEHGYSTKNAMHLIRLLHMGIETIRTGEYNVRRTTDRDILMQVRRGEITEDQVLQLAEMLTRNLDTVAEHTNLPVRTLVHDELARTAIVMSD